MLFGYRPIEIGINVHTHSLLSQEQGFCRSIAKPPGKTQLPGLFASLPSVFCCAAASKTWLPLWDFCSCTCLQPAETPLWVLGARLGQSTECVHTHNAHTRPKPFPKPNSRKDKAFQWQKEKEFLVAISPRIACSLRNASQKKTAYEKNRLAASLDH